MAQNPCSAFDFSMNNTLLNYQDTQQHSTGDHNANMQGTLVCNYYGNNINLPCAAQNDIYSAPTDLLDEWGSLTSIFDCHPLAFGVKTGSSYGPSPQTGTESTVAGANNGLLVAGVCTRGPLSITVSGVGAYSFNPSDKLWAAEQDYQGTCAQEYPSECEEPPPPNNCGDRYVWDYSTCRCRYLGGSPILIDTTKTGFELSAPFKSQRRLMAESKGLPWLGDDRDVPPNEQGCVDFDLKGDGKKDCWSWPIAGSGNGWLVRINNGEIDNGTKLFGDHTPVGCTETEDGGKSLPRGFWNCAEHQPENDRIRNGYFALMEFDTVQNGGNGDFVLNAADEVWKYLRICIDERPRDGMCKLNELHTLDEFNIHSISLIAVVSHRQDRWGNSFKWAAEINADPGTVRDHAPAIHEQALVNQARRDVDIANLPNDPWMSYDVWLVNSDVNKPERSK